MTAFRPISPSHSIEQAVVGVRLLEDATEQAYLKAVSIASDLQERFDLPGRVEADPMALMFGRQAITLGFRATPPEMKSGAIFQRVNRSGTMESELTVERSAVTFRTRDYARWSDMQAFIAGLLAPVASSLCEGQARRITAIELRCIDKFTADVDQPNLLDLINPNSTLVAPFLRDKKDLLHSHIGWFESVSADGRILINVNVDLSETNSKRSASILQVVSSQSKGSKTTYYGRRKFENLISEVLNDLHLRDKSVLGNLLNEDLVALIGLAGSSGVPKL